MQVTRARLFKHGQVVGIGHLPNGCKNAGEGFDLLLDAGYVIQLTRTDPDRDSIDEHMRHGFLDACADANRHAFGLSTQQDK